MCAALRGSVPKPSVKRDATLGAVPSRSDSPVALAPDQGPDPEEAVGLLLRDLGASPDGLSSSEADRRLLQHGPNELQRRQGIRWPAELAEQLTHPLALLLWV